MKERLVWLIWYPPLYGEIVFVVTWPPAVVAEEQSGGHVKRIHRAGIVIGEHVIAAGDSHRVVFAIQRRATAAGKYSDCVGLHTKPLEPSDESMV